jgi:hypothetical protein
MSCYVDLCRAKELAPLADLDDATLAHVLEAACGAVENYCQRTFTVATYDELYQGTRSRSLFLNQAPVTLISGVRYGRQIALQISNSTQYIQAATVECGSTGLTLKFVNNAVTTPNVLTWTANETIGDLANAVNAIGNGWVAYLSPQFESWASSDLSVYRTTQSARNIQAIFSPHYFWLSDYEFNPQTGELVTGSGWNGGYQAYRVQYTAGYSEIPEPLVQATVELAAATWQAGKSDPNLVSESLGQYS